MQAFAETYQQQTKQPIVVGDSGTGAGMNRLCRGDVDMAAASRLISSEEMLQCQHAGISTFEIPIARDAIAVIVNQANRWVDCMSPAELKLMWQSESQYRINQWSQLNSKYASRPLHLFGPSIDSGTYDYFTRAIIGKPRTSRGDYAAAEDYNIIVRGVTGDVNALGLLSMSYWLHNAQQVRALALQQPNGECVLPSIETVREGHYRPLSRELYVYINTRRYQEQANVRQFVGMMLNVKLNQQLTLESGLIPYASQQLHTTAQRVQQQLGADHAH
jgi:phosphate transport system substrate-binding protein